MIFRPLEYAVVDVFSVRVALTGARTKDGHAQEPTLNNDLMSEVERSIIVHVISVHTYCTADADADTFKC